MIYDELVTDPTFPPLLTGEKLAKDVDPFIKAVSASMIGCDPGIVFYAEDPRTPQSCNNPCPRGPAERQHICGSRPDALSRR